MGAAGVQHDEPPVPVPVPVLPPYCVCFFPWFVVFFPSDDTTDLILGLVNVRTKTKMNVFFFFAAFFAFPGLIGRDEICHSDAPSPYVLFSFLFVQANLLARLTAERDDHYTRVTEWPQFVPALNR